MENNIFQKLKVGLPEIKQDVPLKNYTTYKIGGPAKYFFDAKNVLFLEKKLRNHKLATFQCQEQVFRQKHKQA